MEEKIHILNHGVEEIKEKCADIVPEAYRMDQVCQWIFKKKARAFKDMSNLPVPMREKFEQKYIACALEIEKNERSLDDTIKLTFKTKANEQFSAVILPHRTYRSVCISTQVGCAWKCRFCASGLVPYKRNLGSGEILDQILIASAVIAPETLRNVLFMGMGEPLANYMGTLKAVEWMISPKGLGMSPSRITLSTTGLVPQIKNLAKHKLNINLALSLHAPTDYMRKKIMPVSARFKLNEVLEACKLFQLDNNSDLTMEYILLKGVNDQISEAQELDQLLLAKKFIRPPKINLIVYNPISALSYHSSSPEQVDHFYHYLKKRDWIVHIRKPKGREIEAACGQLS